MTYFFQGSSRYAYSLLGIFIFCVIFGVGYSAYRERQTQLTFQLHRAQGSALVVEDQLTQTFQLIESMALTLPELSDKPMDKTRSADLIRLLHGLQLGQPAVRSLSVMTMREGIKASTNSANFGTVVSLDDFFPLDTHGFRGRRWHRGRGRHEWQIEEIFAIGFSFGREFRCCLVIGGN
jgi:hypothetical protein